MHGDVTEDSSILRSDSVLSAYGRFDRTQLNYFPAAQRHISHFRNSALFSPLVVNPDNGESHSVQVAASTELSAWCHEPEYIN